MAGTQQSISANPPRGRLNVRFFLQHKYTSNYVRIFRFSAENGSSHRWWTGSLVLLSEIQS